MRSPISFLFLVAALVFSAFARADKVVDMKSVTAEGFGKDVGSITISENAHGLIFTPALEGLPPDRALHGFHLHENPSCEPGEKDGKRMAALAAGSHYDPAGSKHHGSPWGNGHLGDLPPLYFDIDGKATQPVLAPKLKMENVKGHALVIHAGGDNYSDQPEPLGGGGARIACGVIQ